MTNEKKEPAPKFCKRFWAGFRPHLDNADLLNRILQNKIETQRRSIFIEKQYYGRRFFYIREGVEIVGTVSVQEERLCVEILLEYIGDDDYKISDYDYNRDFFNEMKLQEDEIKDALGSDLELCWMERGAQLREDSEKPRARISCFKNFNPQEEADWENQYKWIIETVEKFDNAFTERLRNVELPQ